MLFATQSTPTFLSWFIQFNPQINDIHQGHGMGYKKLAMDQHGTRNETSMEGHWGLKEMQGDIIIAWGRHGYQE